MKLLNKFLPIATVASVAVAAAPLVITSCSCGASNGVWTKGKTYKPMTPKQGKTIQGTDDNLTKEYENDVKSNNKIFSDDFVNFASRGGYPEFKEAMKFDVTSIKHVTTNVGAVWQNPENGYVFPVSFSMTLTASATISAGETLSKVNYQNAQIVFTNMLISLTYKESMKVLGKEGSIAQCVPASIDILQTNKDWSIYMPELVYDSTKESFTLGNEKIYNVENSLEELFKNPNLMNAFKGFLRFFTQFESNYYYNISIPE